LSKIFVLIDFFKVLAKVQRSSSRRSLIREFGKDSFLLLGPTGMAALNIGGETIHSALRLS